MPKLSVINRPGIPFVPVMLDAESETDISTPGVIGEVDVPDIEIVCQLQVFAGKLAPTVIMQLVYCLLNVAPPVAVNAPCTVRLPDGPMVFAPVKVLGEVSPANVATIQAVRPSEPATPVVNAPRRTAAVIFPELFVGSCWLSELLI